jgi:hypothetical protein
LYATATGCPGDFDGPQLTVWSFPVGSGPVSVFFQFDEPDLQMLPTCE